MKTKNNSKQHGKLETAPKHAGWSLTEAGKKEGKFGLETFLYPINEEGSIEEHQTVDESPVYGQKPPED